MWHDGHYKLGRECVILAHCVYEVFSSPHLVESCFGGWGGVCAGNSSIALGTPSWFRAAGCNRSDKAALRREEEQQK